MIDTSAFQGKKAAYYTLGCKLNFSETSTFGRMLQDMGVVTAEKGEHADICLINTCSVTEVADHKCRQAIHRMVRNHPGAFVVVTGCYAQLEPEEVGGIEGVDLVLGSNEKARLIQYLSEAFVESDGNSGVPASVPVGADAHVSSRIYVEILSHLCGEDEGHKVVPTIMLARQSHPLFPKGAGWVQLFLHILHHTIRSGILP